MEQQSVDAYLAPGKGETTQLSPLDACERKLVKADFSYHETDDTYTCPGGQTLSVVRRNAEGQKVYQGQAAVCAECPYFKRCCQSQK
ncbi:MAG: transposase, partial [Gammaproteobacteria bacterium HGW-Gammaproteobacteria-3]